MSADRTFDETNIHDDGIFYGLFEEAESVRWKMTDYDWSSIDTADVSPGWIAVARETLIGELTTFSATERFFADFGEDVDFTQWLTVWLYEETKHPSVILKWLDAFGEKFDSRFMLQGRQSLPFMPERMGTLASNVISEMAASTSYLTLSEQEGIEPVFKQICRNVSGDEARHGARFYRFARKRLSRSDNPRREKLEALKVLYFWVTPELNGRVGHPVNLIANRYMTMPSLQEAVDAEAIRSAYENTHKRAIRVFGALLDIPLRDRKDVEDQLVELRG